MNVSVSLLKKAPEAILRILASGAHSTQSTIHASQDSILVVAKLH